MKPIRSDLGYRHAQIIDFCLLIKSFFPKYIQTIIPEELSELNQHIQSLEESQKQILQMLIHHLTLLNQHYRVNHNKNRVEVAREDIFTAFYITGELVNPQGFASKSQNYYYKQLQMHFMEMEFTAVQARKALVTSKTNMHRILHFLIVKELIQITKVGIRGMFYYRLQQF